jgi:hypothetical protein
MASRSALKRKRRAKTESGTKNEKRNSKNIVDCQTQTCLFLPLMREHPKASLQTSQTKKVSQIKCGKIKRKTRKLSSQTFRSAATAQATTI